MQLQFSVVDAARLHDCATARLFSPSIQWRMRCAVVPLCTSEPIPVRVCYGICPNVPATRRIYSGLPTSACVALTSNGHTAFVQVFIGSWNMGNAQPPQGPSALNNWIPPFGIDIYAIGVQACNALPQRHPAAACCTHSMPLVRFAATTGQATFDTC